MATNNALVLNFLIDPQYPQVGSPFAYTVPTGAFTDPDEGDTLTYSATLADGSPLPDWLNFDQATATFSGTPPASEGGGVEVLSILIDATDNQGELASGIITFLIGGSGPSESSAPALLTEIADQAASEGSDFSFEVPAETFQDADGDTLTYSAKLADGSALPAWLSFNAETRTFSGTPENDDVGTIEVTVTVSDGSASVSATFSLEVTNVNDAPTLENPIADQTAAEDAVFGFVVPADTFADVDVGDTLTYSATLADGSALPAWLTFDAETRTFSGTPTNADAWTFEIKVTATDKENATTSDIFNIAVANADINIVGDESWEHLYGGTGNDTLDGRGGE